MGRIVCLASRPADRRPFDRIDQKPLMTEKGDESRRTGKMHRSHDHNGFAVIENGVKTGKPRGIGFVDHVLAESSSGMLRAE
jgi:hypothetical protein